MELNMIDEYLQI